MDGLSFDQNAVFIEIALAGRLVALAGLERRPEIRRALRLLSVTYLVCGAGITSVMRDLTLCCRNHRDRQP